MENNTFSEIADKLLAADTVLIFTHVLMDGDALGSSAALCEALRNEGKTAYVLLEDKIPDDMQFLDRGFCTYDQDIIAEPDVCICLDAGDTGRFEKRADKFRTGKTLICVDHHATSEPFCDLNHIDPGEAATAEMVYKLLRAGNMEITGEIAGSIFAGITTDTGNFQYSNTTKQSHEITAALYDAGMDFRGVSIELYECIKPEKIRLQAMIMEAAEFYADGKLVISRVSQDMLKACSCRMEDSEGTVGNLRSIKGVEVAVILKENYNDLIKATMRSKSSADVAAIAAKHEGGGHIRAAGCTIHDTLENAEKIIREDALEELGYK
ncbi:MAG: bifunctional oligoribonuclease/PAP phosphatase NrnA [Eubacteriaceae bacterium]|jgi:phosphoesterase RecJ-like protein|nr:bifunctional oligoribonuclease/PAP phosphatase NrnA [Eubacteriaceae bacterium]